MNRRISLLTVCFGLMLTGFLMNKVSATPLSYSAGALATAAAVTDTVQRVHGCHHYCRRGPAGWHRHGPRCGRWAC